MILDYFWKKKNFSNLLSICIKIISVSKKIVNLSDEQLQKRISKIRSLVIKKKGEEQEKILKKNLVISFAIIKEVIYRKTGLNLFSTQILGGVSLFYENVAQMNTGEGKTLSIFLPVCLSALSNRTVYVVTVNEYLAKRDWLLAKPILDFLSISSGFNSNSLSWEEKKSLYEQKNVIYTTSSEIAFDYLKNNRVTDKEDLIKIDYYYAIVDEADSILLDESCNALILSCADNRIDIEKEKEHYFKATRLSELIKQNVDYKVDEKRKTFWLTTKGIKNIESFYKINNLFDFKNHKYLFLVSNSIKAKHFYLKNVHYVVQQDKIMIINQLTGRLSPNRVYSLGLQQAIESKEEISLTKNSINNATITFQNFFRLFFKLSGTTGTAETEREEFRRVYGLEVIVIPPYKKLIRMDCEDLLFTNRDIKHKAIVNQIIKIKKTTNQPVLIGSSDVDISEELSRLFKEKKIDHFLLNAVNNEKEAEIIAKGGLLGSVIISTNMAGRGTDIKLSEESKKAGGLFVIGVENYFSKRERLQLIGRSGRQGDPGKSKFFICMEDEIIKKLHIFNKMKGFLFGENELFAETNKQMSEPIKGSIVNLPVSEMQENLSTRRTQEREKTLSYDLLINHQRNFFYNIRKKIIRYKSFSEAKQMFLKTNKQNKIILYKKEKNISEFKEKIRLEFLKKRLLKTMDSFWAEYLEVLEKSKELLELKTYAMEDPREAFFWETIDYFKKGLRNLKNNIKKIIIRYKKF